jgi:ankyrin repeat protein
MKLRSFATAFCLLAFLDTAAIAVAVDLGQQLVNAAADQDKTAIRALLKQGANVNATRADGATALLWAAHWNDLETVDLLLHAGAKVNVADDHGVTPLAQAAENASRRYEHDYHQEAFIASGRSARCRRNVSASSAGQHGASAERCNDCWCGAGAPLRRLLCAQWNVHAVLVSQNGAATTGNPSDATVAFRIEG